VPHISMVTLGVDDLARATAFYEACGWERSSASVPAVVSFLHGSTAALGLFGRDALAAERAGAVITKPAAPTDWGGYAGSFQDLDGHLWEVAHNPFFPLRDDGGVVLPTDDTIGG